MRINLSTFMKAVLLGLVLLLGVELGSFASVSSSDPINRVLSISRQVDQFKPVELPNSVTVITINMKVKSLPVTWDSTKIDTSRIGRVTIKGKVKETSIEALLVVNVVANVVAAENVTDEVMKFGTYNLPKYVRVTLSNEKNENRAVIWSTDQVDTSKVGTIVLDGTVVGTNVAVKCTVKVRTNFKAVEKSAVYSKWGYYSVIFTQQIAEIQNPQLIVLKDNKGNIIKIDRVAPGVSDKLTLVITTSQKIEKNIPYTLIIPENSVKSANGEMNDQSFEFVIVNNN